MKAILIYRLPNDAAEYESAINAAKYVQTIWEIQQILRAHGKHGDNDDLKQCQAVIDTIRSIAYQNDLPE